MASTKPASNEASVTISNSMAGLSHRAWTPMPGGAARRIAGKKKHRQAGAL
jgi:hypothetical protein